ncbi:3-phosphoshikimate 1-carboxyvinyltransferase [Halalkalibacterium halodurans]|uniref:3-phosphoshikimate 1-carboxyvinyltransferase n=1 Tax=Halalkalibacterium halodurans TaxID=86665 RepID=UPI002E2359BD|nr:3-phosphoshikimate 1-carboxyvinyltransferase [Halalkalibacterium halodurans]MED4080300.1 3-phosphoshikimate 1-carboxyvinyltransferase [Halalkalibacterium halodurans]MED4084632.1 3-phosphoshikimate 1-carboxyvinyltransferase [Halalkalibacterium halodurans]MED4103988.1 3-phosphoshikimate 1-carboxyvinyltransferase [Halalkalibacterium halodurans]MED4108940.1 3-phosphoshikimate 1-carboxyvinyltransferase [Halalkalibacterium halodurans]MED4125260.1 3-phosphoshikimate 1-carboxyvinyltransferase [Hala
MTRFDENARSPWTPLHDVKTVELFPLNQRLDGSITLPGSKSLTNRALIISALANGDSMLTGMLKSDDTYWCIQALKRLGVQINVQGETTSIRGIGGQWKSSSLYIGAAGTLARFLLGALAISRSGNWEIEASQSMSKRPIEPLVGVLRELGATIHYLRREGFYPLSIHGNGLAGGTVRLSGQMSSQYISGLLIAAPYADTPVTITVQGNIVQHSYVFLTLHLMKTFGANVEYDQQLQTIIVQPTPYTCQDIDLEADASTACYFLALAALTKGRIRLNNLTASTTQPDLHMLTVFEKMGCTVTRGSSFIELEGVSQLKGGFQISMNEMSDQALTLAAIAPFADGPITITDVEHIRYHESDRIAVICEALTRLGIQVDEFEDGLTVYPGTPKPTLHPLSTYDDHRVAMSLSLIGTKVKGLRLNDPGCVAKTCPSYFQLLEQLGIQVHYQ